MFTLPSNTTIAGARWWGVTTAPGVANFTVRIFSTSGGVPATTPLYNFAIGGAVGWTAAEPIGGTPQYRYDATLPTTDLGSGTYLMSIVNDTGAAADWAWSYGSGNALRFRNSDAATWNSFGGAPLFQLTGEVDAAAVPEPGAALLFLPALGVVALARRRRS